MKRLEIKNGLLFFTTLLLSVSLMNCSKIVDSDQKAPVIREAVTDLSVKMNDSIEIHLEHIEVYDINGDELMIFLLDGLNYQVRNNFVIPELDFVGDLYVEYQIVDNSGLSSLVDTIIISVLPDIQEINPLYVGARWIYSDTFYLQGKDSLDSSIFEITDIYSPEVAGTSSEVFVGEWKNIAQEGYPLHYIYTNTEEGLYLLGGYSSTDTLISPELKLKNPVHKGDNWEYSLLRYNKDLGKFFKDTTISNTECTTEKVYIKVPAGIFQCIEYTYSYLYDPTNTWGARDRSFEELGTEEGTTFIHSRNRVDDEDITITVKLYFSPGIGYIQNLTYRNDVLIQKKTLTHYNVNEKL